MMHSSKEVTKLVLADDGPLGRVEVELEAFFAFSFEIAEDLQDVIDRWQHTASLRAINLQRTTTKKPR